MDWTKQTEEMMKNWTETQKKMWDSWLEAIPQGVDQSQTVEMWQKAVDTWETMVQNTLDVQAEWTKTWADSLDLKSDIPDEMVEWAKQAQKMMKDWGETQQQLWHGWFDLVKQADPTKMADAWGIEGQKGFQAWQESAQKMMDTQMKWASMWTPGQANEKAAE